MSLIEINKQAKQLVVRWIKHMALPPLRLYYARAELYALRYNRDVVLEVGNL